MDARIAVKKGQRLVRKYYPRTSDRAVRPLYGPNAHPFLVATRQLWADLHAAPKEERDARRQRAIRQLAKEQGERFAGIIDWAIRERERPLRPSGPKKQTECQRGHSLEPGSPHLRVERDGTRHCATCKKVRALRAARRRDYVSC